MSTNSSSPSCRELSLLDLMLRAQLFALPNLNHDISPERIGSKDVNDTPLFPGPLQAYPVAFAGPVSFDEPQPSSCVYSNYSPSYTGLLSVYLLRRWLGAEAGLKGVPNTLRAITLLKSCNHSFV
jgi:hypothetical protein